MLEGGGVGWKVVGCWREVGGCGVLEGGGVVLGCWREVGWGGRVWGVGEVGQRDEFRSSLVQRSSVYGIHGLLVNLSNGTILCAPPLPLEIL